MTEQQASYNSLSVIDSVDVSEVRGTMDKISQFQGVVQKQLRQNHDYGVLPGTPKPTLLKPGAEKIIMLLGLRSEFEIIDSTRDWDSGFFQYQVRCSLYKGETLITQGLGAANNREKKWLKQDPYSIDNTILKMARKRSLTDGALTVGSLSDIFHQDLEDMDLAGDKASGQKKTYTDQDGTISKAQAKRMFAIAEGDQDLVKKALKEYKHEKTEQVKKTEYDAICKKIEELKAQPEEQGPGQAEQMVTEQQMFDMQVFKGELDVDDEGLIQIAQSVINSNIDSLEKLTYEQAEMVLTKLNSLAAKGEE